jgi:hypothetical protein
MQFFEHATLNPRHISAVTLVLIDFSRNCLFIDLTIFGTSCFSNHLGLHNSYTCKINSLGDHTPEAINQLQTQQFCEPYFII